VAPNTNTQPRRRAPSRPPVRPAKRRRFYGWVGGVAVALAVLGVLFVVFRSNNPTAARAGGHTLYQVGNPGISQPAPGFTLPSSNGGSISLASLHGKTTLLYFQEGIGCEPCWSQLKDLEAAAGTVHAAGIDNIVSITTQPANLLAQKAHDEAITTPVLADTSLAVSKNFGANGYGMMGDSMDGHSFILVGPDGKIQWRADYGGAPRYTMYVPVQQLLADLAAGRRR